MTDKIWNCPDYQRKTSLVGGFTDCDFRLVSDTSGVLLAKRIHTQASDIVGKANRGGRQQVGFAQTKLQEPDVNQSFEFTPKLRRDGNHVPIKVTRLSLPRCSTSALLP